MTNSNKSDDKKTKTESKWKDFSKQNDEQDVEKTSHPDESFIDFSNNESLEFPSHQKLEEELNVTDAELAKYKDQAVRAMAELENVQRRSAREVLNAKKFGSEKLMSDLLPIADSLIRGLEGIDRHQNDLSFDAVKEGMSLTLDLLSRVLEKHGMKVIDPKPGDAFNPECHQAMSMQQKEGAEANTVLQVLQRGYELNGRVLRAAMVIVAQ